MKRIFLVFLFVLLAVTTVNADPVDVTFYWEYDNADFSTIEGFNLYMKNVEDPEYPTYHAFTVTATDACQGNPLTCCMINEIDGIKMFVLTAFVGEDESEYSEEIYFDPEALQPPYNLRIVVPEGN